MLQSAKRSIQSACCLLFYECLLLGKYCMRLNPLVKDAPFFTESFQTSGAHSVLLALFLPLETGHGVCSAPLASSQYHFQHLALYLM